MKAKQWLVVTSSVLAVTLGLVASAQQAKTEIVYWSMWNPSEPEGIVVQKAVTAFEAANPTVKVNLNFIGRDIRKLAPAALDSGKTIDVIENDSGWLAENAGKYLLPLESYLSQPAVGVPGKSVRQTINKALLEQYKVEGKIVSMPYQPFAVLFFYNKDHFQKAGILKEPTTWAQLRAASDKLKKAGFEPITTESDAFQDVILGYYVQRASGGCDVLQSALNDKTGKSWSGPVFTQMARDIAGLASSGYIAKGTAANKYPAGEQRVALGEVSMYLNGTWLPKEVKGTAGPDFRWGSFPFPSVAGGKGSVNDVMTGAQAIALIKSTKVSKEAFNLVRYIVSKDAQTSMVNDAGSPAAHIGVTWSGPIQEAGVALGKARRAFGWGCDIGKVSEVGYNIIIPAFGDLLVGKISPDQYLERTVNESAKYWASRK